MQDLGERGAHAGALAGGEDHDGGLRHAGIVVSARRLAARSLGEWCNWKHGSLWLIKTGFDPWLPSWCRAWCRFEPDFVRLGCEHVFVSRKVVFTEPELREVVAGSRCYAEVLRKLGRRPAGGNHGTIKKYVARWGISTEHFDQDAIRREALSRPPIPLADVLVEHSTYHRGHLKRRLLAEGVKRAECQLCGQGASWRGRPLALILDHINGVPDDNRLENLRIFVSDNAIRKWVRAYELAGADR
jgi:hypothetical protein